MKQIVLYLLCAAASYGLCCADVTKLSVEDRKILENASPFHDAHSSNGIPSEILALCDGGSDDKLAEPGLN